MSETAVRENHPMERHLNIETNKIRKNLMNFNLNNYGSLFTISVATMDISYPELWELLNDNWLKK